MTTFTESTVEDAALAWLEAAGWRIARGPDIAPESATKHRKRGRIVCMASMPSQPFSWSAMQRQEPCLAMSRRGNLQSADA